MLAGRVGSVLTRGANMQRWLFKTAPGRHVTYLGEITQAVAIALADD